MFARPQLLQYWHHATTAPPAVDSAPSASINVTASASASVAVHAKPPPTTHKSAAPSAKPASSAKHSKP